MTNYNGEKGKRLRGSMAPKTDDEVALAGTNSGETENKQESLSGTNSGERRMSLATREQKAVVTDFCACRALWFFYAMKERRK